MKSQLKKKEPVHNSANQPKNTENPKLKYYLLAGIIFLVLIVYSNSFQNTFVNWDDDRDIVNNELIRDCSFEGFKKIFTSEGTDYYRPLSLVLYSVEYKIWGLNPKPFIFINLLLHLLNVILVFWLIYYVSGKKYVSAIVAALFGIHPMAVETVSWLTEQKTVLYSFFFLLSLICYFYYITQKKIKFYVFAIILFIISLLSKSAAVTLPVILVLIDFYNTRKISRNVILEKIPFFVLSIIFGIILLKTQKDVITDSKFVYNFFERIFLASYSLWFYVYNVFFPFHLSAIHPYPVHPESILPGFYYFSFVIVLLMVLGFVFLIKKSIFFKRELIFGVLFFIISIGLVLQIVSLGGPAITGERFTYIAYIGIFFVIGTYLNQIFESRSKFRTISFVFLTVYVFGFSIVSYSRVNVWKDSINLWNDVIEKDGTIEAAYFNRGKAKDDIKDFKGAVTDYSVAIAINPSNSESYVSRGNSNFKLNDSEGVIADYSQAIKLKPEYADAYYNRGNAEINTKNYVAAKSDFDKAIELNPNYTNAYISRAIVFALQNDYGNSLQNLDKAIEINPNSADAYKNRGIAKFKLNQKEDACKDWQKAVNYGDSQAMEFLSKYCKGAVL